MTCATSKDLADVQDALARAYNIAELLALAAEGIVRGNRETGNALAEGVTLLQGHIDTADHMLRSLRGEASDD